MWTPDILASEVLTLVSAVISVSCLSVLFSCLFPLLLTDCASLGGGGSQLTEEKQYKSQCNKGKKEKTHEKKINL